MRKGALEMERKVIPIGYEDIREIIDKNLYYVDKSLLIRELLDSGGKVSLVTRPRRFGKTLNLSMLRRFLRMSVHQWVKKWITAMSLMIWQYYLVERGICSTSNSTQS